MRTMAETLGIDGHMTNVQLNTLSNTCSVGGNTEDSGQAIFDLRGASQVVSRKPRNPSQPFSVNRASGSMGRPENLELLKPTVPRKI